MGAKMNNFQCFFAQKLKLHFLDRLFFNISLCRINEFWFSCSPESLCFWTGCLRSLPIHTKRVKKLYSWDLDRVTAQVRKLAMARETTLCCSASWQVSQGMELLGSCSIHSPFRGINLSFFIPVHPLIFTFGFNTFKITACSTALDWTQLLVSTVIGRDGQKGEAQTDYDWTYPPTSSLEVFLQGKRRIVGINMQRLYPTRMYSFR